MDAVDTRDELDELDPNAWPDRPEDVIGGEVGQTWHDLERRDRTVAVHSAEARPLRRLRDVYRATLDGTAPPTEDPWGDQAVKIALASAGLAHVERALVPAERRLTEAQAQARRCQEILDTSWGRYLGARSALRSEVSRFRGTPPDGTAREPLRQLRELAGRPGTRGE